MDLILFRSLISVEVVMDNENNFMDKKTLIAIFLIGISWVGWQFYLGKKYPQANKAPVTETQKNPEVSTVQDQAGSEIVKAETLSAKKEKSEIIPTKEVNKEGLSHFENENLSLDISSFGMGVKNLTLKKYVDRAKNQVQLGHEKEFGLFEVRFVGATAAIPFQIEKKSETLFEGTFNRGTMSVTRTIEIDNYYGTFKSRIFIKNPDAEFKGIDVVFAEPKLGEVKSSFLVPSFEHQEFVVHHADKSERINISSEKEPLNKNFNGVSMTAIGSQYFATAIADKSEIIPEAHLQSKENILNILSYKPVSFKELMEINFIGYAGPKSFTILEKIDAQFIDIVNFGFFATIAKILLNLLRLFHTFVNNWGVSIILLTLLVRLLVLPFNLFSYKSMKRMQKIQPLMQSLRERYKDDPQAMNRETMALMKEHKVNPVGGCLPMLLQMPVFFALYQVLGQSIELYQAPFVGWIHDLSLKDPYFVLPILMSAAMWFQQKITPTTADPTQAKIMQYLPLVFGFMMISLPSGLTLYIFISTLFAVIQQYFFMKDNKTVNVKNEAKA